MDDALNFNVCNLQVVVPLCNQPILALHGYVTRTLNMGNKAQHALFEVAEKYGINVHVLAETSIAPCKDISGHVIVEGIETDYTGMTLEVIKALGYDKVDDSDD